MTIARLNWFNEIILLTSARRANCMILPTVETFIRNQNSNTGLQTGRLEQHSGGTVALRTNCSEKQNKQKKILENDSVSPVKRTKVTSVKYYQEYSCTNETSWRYSNRQKDTDRQTDTCTHAPHFHTENVERTH